MTDRQIPDKKSATAISLYDKARERYRRDGLFPFLTVAGRTVLGRVSAATGFSRIVIGLINAIASAEAPRFLYWLAGVSVNQAWPQRRSAIMEVVKSSFCGPVRAVEIGAWFGEGSTRIWLESLPRGPELVIIDSWCPYLSDSDLRQGASGYRAMNDLSFPAIHHVLKSIRKYERRGGGVKISLIRSKASEILQDFRDNRFDFIFIDGSHHYDAVRQDIDRAKSLVRKDFSIICGDDLEQLPTPELVAFNRNHKGDDFVDGFHPGVLLAVSEQFERVNMTDGFWRVYCVDGSYTTERPQVRAPRPT
jgi:hypothetical protein